ncbi:hypothetical protein WA026_012164 [Henosepilachna vigintioctopunctata]|uniref:Uncharacterized protein n=1 Tax=Henosepilachna vigintioctopunctata TaxID=420089 RepID=A0AAW1VEB5_9CUCU
MVASSRLKAPLKLSCTDFKSPLIWSKITMGAIPKPNLDARRPRLHISTSRKQKLCAEISCGKKETAIHRCSSSDKNVGGVIKLDTIVLVMR